MKQDRPDILKKRQTLLDDQKRGNDACPIGRVPAAEIETAVIDQLREFRRKLSVKLA